MAEEVQQLVLKHVCKFCRKSFSCGRSLGGHMRSHMINDITSQPDGTQLTKKKLPSLLTTTTTDSSNSYVLRENPKKTWRIPDQESSFLDKSCKQCGKLFPSWKALFGHMKCHSIDKDKLLIIKQEEHEQEQDEHEDSWASVMDSQSDNETAAPNRKKRSQRRTRKVMGTPANSSSSLCFANTTTNNNNASSSVTESEQEQEEVAICLMMLSRDVGGLMNTTNSVAESSDNNFESRKTEHCVSEFSRKVSKKKKPQSQSQSQSQLDDECVVENSGIELGKRKLIDSFDPERNSRFECTTCNKMFHSYQALGGHRASHKKNKGCYASSENSIETVQLSPDPYENHTDFEKKADAKKSKLGHHACPICFKVFPSGQALGGHKRSHLVASNTEAKNNQNLAIQEPIHPPIRDFLDLNLPAPADEETNGLLGFNQWWISSSHKHESLVGLISN